MIKKQRGRKLPKAALLMRNSLLSALTALLLLSFYWFTEKLAPVETPSSEHPLQFYANQASDDLEQTFTQAILQAKKSVLLIVYTITDPKIIRSLNEMSKKGLEIKVICDGKENPGIARKLNSKISIVTRFNDERMHLKILMIDAEQVWIGSANMTGESLRMHGNLVIGLNSRSLGDMVAAKADGLVEEGVAGAIKSKDFLFDGQVVELWFLPENNRQAIERLKQLIAGAKKSIRIAMFTWTRMDLAQAVADASRRGIKVEVAIDSNCGKGCGAKVVEFLSKNTLYMGLHRGSGLLHHKFMIIDDAILATGSANWTHSAFKKNDDCFLVVNNLNQEQRTKLKKVWKVIKSESSP